VRDIPVALILTIILQTGGFVWWLAGLSATVENLGREQAKLAGQVSQLSIQVSASSAPMAVNGVEIAALKNMLAELRGRVDSVQVEQARRTALELENSRYGRR